MKIEQLLHVGCDEMSLMKRAIKAEYVTYINAWRIISREMNEDFSYDVFLKSISGKRVRANKIKGYLRKKYQGRSAGSVVNANK